MDFFSHYNTPSDEGVSPVGESLTQAEYAADCDINVMIRRALSGDATVMRHPCYANVLGSPADSHELANKLANANTIWHDLPDKLRETFGSPEALLKHIDDLEAKELASREAALQEQLARESQLTESAKNREAVKAATGSVVSATAGAVAEPSTGEARA